VPIVRERKKWAFPLHTYFIFFTHPVLDGGLFKKLNVAANCDLVTGVRSLLFDTFLTGIARSSIWRQSIALRPCDRFARLRDAAVTRQPAVSEAVGRAGKGHHAVGAAGANGVNRSAAVGTKHVPRVFAELHGTSLIGVLRAYRDKSDG
jgi:hypothetical protein